jgi:adenylate cyclase
MILSKSCRGSYCYKTLSLLRYTTCSCRSHIIQCGSEQSSPIDILGYSMNIAAKITSLTDANKVSIGENVYKSLNSITKSEFSEISLPDNRWKYINYGTDRPYKVYTLNH